MPDTWEQHEKKLDDPALCELLPVRDYLDSVLIRTSGALVAGYELRGNYFLLCKRSGKETVARQCSALCCKSHSGAEHENAGPL